MSREILRLALAQSTALLWGYFEPWFIFKAVEVLLMLTPLALSLAAWQRWWETQRPRDLPFVIGASLATLSGCVIIPFLLPITTRLANLQGAVMLYCAIVTAACSVAALVVLPSAKSRAKWLALTSSVMTLLFFAMLVFLFV